MGTLIDPRASLGSCVTSYHLPCSGLSLRRQIPPPQPHPLRRTRRTLWPTLLPKLPPLPPPRLKRKMMHVCLTISITNDRDHSPEVDHARAHDHVQARALAPQALCGRAGESISDRVRASLPTDAAAPDAA